MFTVTEESAKRLARTVEKYFQRRDVALERGQALDLIAAMQGYDSWKALAATLKSGGSFASHGDVSKVSQPSLEQPLTIYVEAFSCDGEGSAPAWAKIELDQLLWGRLITLRDLVEQMNLMEMSDWHSPVWAWDSPQATDSEMNDRLDVPRLEVADDRFWYFARTHYADTQVETQPLVFEALESAIRQGDCADDRLWRRGNVVVYAARRDRESLIDVLIEDGEPLDGFRSSIED